MHTVALDRVEPLEPHKLEPAVHVLLANVQPAIRRHLTALPGNGAAVAIFEAADGAEALQIALQRHPQIALLAVAMPHLGGLEAAVTIREMEPRMRLALHTVDISASRDWACELGFPLFDTADHARIVGWLDRQVQWFDRRLAFACSSCGYGVVRSTPPARCPMCQARGAWALMKERPTIARENGVRTP